MENQCIVYLVIVWWLSSCGLRSLRVLCGLDNPRQCDGAYRLLAMGKGGEEVEEDLVDDATLLDVAHLAGLRIMTF